MQQQLKESTYGGHPSSQSSLQYSSSNPAPLRRPFTVPRRLLHVMRGHKGAVLNLKPNDDGKYCISCGQDRTLHLWNPHKGLHIKEYRGPHNHEVFDVAISKDNSKFVSVGGDKIAFLWDVTTGNVVRKFSGHDGRIYCCRLCCTNDQLLVTGSYDKTVRIWDMRSTQAHRPIQILKDAKDAVTCTMFNDTEILTGSVDGCIRSYDVRSGHVATDQFHIPIASMDISNDGKAALICCLDSSLRLLDRTSGEQLNTFKGHKNSNYLHHAELDPTENFAVCGSEDGRLCVWNICTTDSYRMVEERVDEESHGGAAIFAVRFTKSKTSTAMMLTGGNDKTIRVWAQYDT